MTNKKLLLTLSICAATVIGSSACGMSGQNPAEVRAKLAENQPPILTPETKEVLQAIANLHPTPIDTLTPAEARRQPTFADGVAALLKSKGKSTEPIAVGSVAPLTIPGPGNGIPAKVYTPEGTGPFPVLVYYHGGGWVLADANTYDASARALTKASNRIVVSVNYRQAPENKFPAAVQDAYTAYKWVLENASTINGDSSHVAIGGESAGGNLAAATTLFAREKGVAQPEQQVLIYPVLDYAFNTPSYDRNSYAKPLNRDMMKWFWRNYLGSVEDQSNPYAAPLRAKSLAGLAPATIITAEVDPLQSEGVAYAERLKSAGVPVRFKNFDGVTHEFFGAGAVIPEAKSAVEFAAQSLKTK